ncbi:pyridoxamine 5'-phosphate oxidase [Neptuniibacter caesariensis]|uniref:Pyridoxine/pyridoxamine 5'-phosphate oxidase n=1 Tax=Neptuniibacter caesariensis TaxID=207954 RepID=A0A7U8C1G5_NEPCE|nr:pyridoxamine 5'-phosphate oxidase [Neptuniibacter caesariensis]EAR59793.1 Pyridoxamine 5'-phosphate oxidase [Oceanospirillum sp. MED92] [Neptuniibacter caesariensis]
MTNKGDLTAQRREYLAQPLRREDLNEDPIAQFAKWMDDAIAVSPDDATSMTLATASKEGMPSARIVLLKHFDADGFAWYTDYRSQKGAELAENPQAEIMFYWYGLERQVRIQGNVEKLSQAQGEKYFNERPLGSRISAAASHQSHPVESREALESSVKALQERYPEGDVPHPEQWGGYLLKPTRIEFWQGRESRLHDRFQFNLTDEGWSIQRLQP